LKSETAGKRKKMIKFARVKMILGKDIKKGDKESIQTLFHSVERYRPITLLAGGAEDANLRVTLRGLGSADLKLGDDMRKGQVKTVMTLFWFAERAKPFEMKHKARAGKVVTIEMSLAPAATTAPPVPSATPAAP
jgi:hypothetical protein